MSLTTSVQGWLAAVGPREASATTARRHVAAETGTDVDAICATVARDVFFALPVRTRAGHELPPGTVLTEGAQVRAYYEGRSGSYVVRESCQVTSLSTGWYVCNESAATLLGTGVVGDVDATGREWSVRSVVLFPTAADGIRGEICATRHPFADVLRGDVVAEPGDAVANARLLDRFATGLRDGEVIALAPSHTMAVQVAGEVFTSWERPLFEADDVAVLVRHATDWYVFAEYLFRRPGSHRRLAVLQPVEGGQVLGTYGYGVDEPA